jgi:hypothetical protein
MTTDGRAALLAILALSTGHTSMNSFKTSQLDKGRDDVVPNAVLVIGMATDLIVQAMNPRDVGSAVQCMSNILRHAGDKISHGSLHKFKVITSSTAGGTNDAKAVIKAITDPDMIYKWWMSLFFMADNVGWQVKSGQDSGTYMTKTLDAHRLP